MITYHILTLKHRKDRQIYICSNFDTQEVPVDWVKFHEGPYGLEYPTGSAVCDAAVADGFETFDKMRKYPRGTLASLWGTLRILTEIASAEHRTEYGYYNQDDKLLMIHNDEVRDILRYLDRPNERPPFLFWQLTHQTQDVIARGRTYQPLTPGSPLCKGIPAMGDSGLVMSKAGAQFLIDAFHENPKGSMELVIGELSPNIEGVYSVRHPRNFIKSLNVRWWDKDDPFHIQDRQQIDRQKE